jgi:hypothetical protein
MRKEFRSALELLAPDYSLAKLDGTPLKRAQLEENWKGLTEKFKSAGTARVEIEKLSTEGKTARTSVHLVLFYSVSGPTEKSESQEWFSDARLQDTWSKTPSGWRLQRSVEMRANIGGVLRSEKGVAESPRLAALERQLKERDADALDALWHEVRGKGPLAPNGFPQGSEIYGTRAVDEKPPKNLAQPPRFMPQSVHESTNPGFSGEKRACYLVERVSS